jgi:serine/threonine-protein kinase
LFLARMPTGQTLVKVLDFGISKSLDTHLSGDHSSLTRTTAIMGSPHYMSPEQMRAARAVDCRADVWGLGVCLYQLLTGRVPFEAESLIELGAKVLHEAPSSPATLRGGLHATLVAVVLKCLEKDPQKRYANAGELASALRTSIAQGALNASETWTAPPPDSVDQPTRIGPIPEPVRAKAGLAPAAAPPQPGSYGGRTNTAWGESHADLQAKPRVSAVAVALATFFGVLIVTMAVLFTVTHKRATNASPSPSSPSGTTSSATANPVPTGPASADTAAPADTTENATAPTDGVPAPPATGVAAADGAPDAGVHSGEGHHHAPLPAAP